MDYERGLLSTFTHESWSMGHVWKSRKSSGLP